MRKQEIDHDEIHALYEESEVWHVNTGGNVIHAKRMGGRFRMRKWWANAFWLILFLGPYLRWDDRQAVLFDIPNRQFQIFGATVLPQDFWLLALTLIFFAILLAVVTAVAGRIWCGYFCFQTVWTDVYTWIEEKLEGNPQKRRKLDAAPMSLAKLRIKTTKHFIWLAIGALTGISFIAWFQDAFTIWAELFTLELHVYGWATIAVFMGFTYLFAGFMREQVCFWLCPYARIQGVMYDRQTILPTYDFDRGEPRGRVQKDVDQEGHLGDCIDCNQCVAVCPTGVDIRHGQQEGCITCGLCIDACDSIMDKVNRPHGLIRYASLKEMEGESVKPPLKRARVLVYLGIIFGAAIAIIYGLANLSAVELKVLHERQPLFVLQSDGSIQNKYILKILNKTDQTLTLRVLAEGPQGLTLSGLQGNITAKNGKVSSNTLFVRVPRTSLAGEMNPITFRIETVGDSELFSEYESIFIGPRY